MVTTFGDMIRTLESYEVLDVFLPFLLIFTVTYAVLQKANLLGSTTKPYNKIIAFVLALAAVIPHVLGTYPAGADVIDIINTALPNVSLIMIAALMALLMIGVFGKEINIGGTSLAGWAVLFSLVAVTFIFLNASGVLNMRPAWLSWLFDPETQSLLIIILVFGGIIWFITKEEKPGSERQSINKTIDNMFGGVLGGGKK